MSERPSWLPPLEPVDGPQADVIAALYRVFVASFAGDLSFQGLPVAVDRGIAHGATYVNGFWHFITRQDQKARERRFDPRRGERIAWCAAILANSTDPAIKIFDYREGHGRYRTYVWLEEHDYVVVLEHVVRREQEFFFIVTAYWVEGRSTRRDLLRKYQQRRA